MHSGTIDTSRTSLTTSSGAMIDLLNPRPADIDFEVVAEHLAKANRYCGATPDVAYNVAEHSVRCADLAYQLYGEKTAAYALCHDMHEAYLGDDTTPKKRALEAIMQSFGVLAGEIEKAFAALTERLDAAIHERAGLVWPMNPETRAAVHYVDRVLLATEWRDLMRCQQPYEFGVQPLGTRPITTLSWRPARSLFFGKCKDYLPSLREKP